MFLEKEARKTIFFVMESNDLRFESDEKIPTEAYPFNVSLGAEVGMKIFDFFRTCTLFWTFI